MTIKDKITSLNSDFQKSNHDMDFAFFSNVAPAMLIEMKDFINSIIPYQHKLFLSAEKHLALIDHELLSLAVISKKPNAGIAIRDNYLIAAKKNISQALWRVYDDIRRHDANILEQQYQP